MSFTKKSFADIYQSMEIDSRKRLPQLTDFEEGSVVRSLFESFAYELAVLYEQMDQVYQASFIDTATAQHLDRVVAVLGVQRDEPDYATGSVTFTRDDGQDEALEIPLGTQIMTEEDLEQDPSQKIYKTVEVGRLAVHQTQVSVPVQALERSNKMRTGANTVLIMPRPVPGIKSVTNPTPIRFLGRGRETDEQLRSRAKKMLLASGRASMQSVEDGILNVSGVRQVRIREDFAGGGDATQNLQALKSGVVEVYVDGLTAQNRDQVRKRIDANRAAGVYAILKPAIAIKLEAVFRIDIDSGIKGEEQKQVEKKASDAIIHFIDRVRMGQPLLFSQLTSKLLQVKGVTNLAKFTMTSYRDDDQSFATGTVTLTRKAYVDKNITIPAQTILRTTTNQAFRIQKATLLAENKTTIDVPVTAVTHGSKGQLLRTAPYVNWQQTIIDGVPLIITNTKPMLLERKQHNIVDNRITSRLLERFSPASIRVAASEKPLPVHLHVQLTNVTGDARKDASKKVNDAIKAYFGKLKAGESFLKPTVETEIKKAIPKATFTLTMISHPFQLPHREEGYQVTVSFVEKAQAAIIFVYTERVELAGTMRLILALNATSAVRQAAVAAARRDIAAYLESLRPETGVDLKRIATIARRVSGVLRIEFDPDKCQLLRQHEKKAWQAIDKRNRNNAITVEPFEKVFLSAKQFVIQA